MVLTRSQRQVLLGDVVLLVILTIVGFASHNELNAGWRMLTTFLPALIAWVWAAPWLGLYNEKTLYSPRQMAWRAAWAWTLAGPLATLLRAIWLNRVVIPIFALVFTGLNLVVFAVWRAGYAWFNVKRFHVAAQPR